MKFSDLYDKTIIDLTTSKVCGQVKKALLNGTAVEYLVTDSGCRISVGCIHSAADNIACVSTESNANEVIRNDASNFGAQRTLTAIGAPIVTSDGKNIGSVFDYSITPDWRVSRIYTEDTYINFKRVYNCNEGVMIIKGRKALSDHSLPDNVNSADNQIKSENETFNDILIAPSESDNCQAENLNMENQNANGIDTPYNLITINDRAVDADESITDISNTTVGKEVSSLADLTAADYDVHGACLPTIISNYDFLIGRKVNKTIFNKNGEVIIVKNGIIDSSTVKKSVASNRLAELAIYSDRN